MLKLRIKKSDYKEKTVWTIQRKWLCFWLTYKRDMGTHDEIAVFNEEKKAIEYLEFIANAEYHKSKTKGPASHSYSEIDLAGLIDAERNKELKRCASQNVK